MLNPDDPNAARPFVLTTYKPTGDRLTRLTRQTRQFATEAEAMQAYNATTGAAGLVELTGIGTCRPIAFRPGGRAAVVLINPIPETHR
jgi:hypothetical protein